MDIVEEDMNILHWTLQKKSRTIKPTALMFLFPPVVLLHIGRYHSLSATEVLYFVLGKGKYFFPEWTSIAALLVKYDYMKLMFIYWTVMVMVMGVLMGEISLPTHVILRLF